MQPEVYEKIEAYIKQLEKCMRAEMQFTLILDDPAGNSFVENPMAPQEDPNLQVSHYDRTEAQSEQVGVVHNNKKMENRPIEPQVNSVTGEVTGPKKSNVAAQHKQGSLIRMLNPNETLDALSTAIKVCIFIDNNRTNFIKHIHLRQKNYCYALLTHLLYYYNT